MAAQRDPRYWRANAHLFAPEELRKDPLSIPILNFGLGSQSCIGRHVAEMEVKIMGTLFSILLTQKLAELPQEENHQDQPLSSSQDDIGQPSTHQPVAFDYNNFTLAPARNSHLYRKQFERRPGDIVF